MLADTRSKPVNISIRGWWEDENFIDDRVYGVFEGGGAKGVLYAGALEGMLAARCWFDAVAGASAGAITATLVAAGMRPEQIKQQTNDALATLRSPTPLNAALRLRDGISVLDQDGLLTWVREMLEHSFLSLASTPGGAGATFLDLYELTGIELHVVAVDLTRHQLVVFNHQLTPTCQVAEAVVASAAIPYAFEARRLHVPGRQPGMIVDGGIAANFPSFVFKDRSFRHWAGLRALPDETKVVGFLLDEGHNSRDETLRAYHECLFRPALEGLTKRRFRVGRDANREAAQRSASLVSRLARIVVFPLKALLWSLTQFFFNWFPALLSSNTLRSRTPALVGDPSWVRRGVHSSPDPCNGDGSTDRAEPGTRPSRRGSAVASRAALGFDRIMIATRSPLMFAGALLVISLSLGAGLYHYGWQPLVDHFGDIVNGQVSIFGAIVGIIVYLGVISAALYAWIILVVLFVAASFTHATTRTIGYGLVKTFLQGPGAPPWTGSHEDDHVIRLRVPAALTTLEASLPEKQMACALAAAKKVTRAKIDAIRADQADQSFDVTGS